MTAIQLYDQARRRMVSRRIFLLKKRHMSVDDEKELKEIDRRLNREISHATKGLLLDIRKAIKAAR